MFCFDKFLSAFRVSPVFGDPGDVNQSSGRRELINVSFHTSVIDSWLCKKRLLSGLLVTFTDEGQLQMSFSNCQEIAFDGSGVEGVAELDAL